MHELAIANTIVTTVLHEIERQDLPPVKAVVVRVGALSGVVPEALQFNFEAITIDTPLAHTKLEIEKIPVQGKCRKCSREFTVKNYLFVCPSCQSGQIQVTQGEELDIAYLEVEDGHDGKIDG
ncbi:MAG: hydrogenase maturation nickel metallochaperone HypA [bacterium]